MEQGNKAGEKVGVIATEETKGLYEGGIVKSIGSRKDELSIARHLSGILRDFDELKVDRIYSEAFDTPRMGQAIMNRLMKAAGATRSSVLGRKRMKRFDRLIFVSNSDTCRAPMAKGIMRSKYLLSDLEVDSRGLVVLFRSL